MHFFFDTLQLWLEPKAVSVILQPVPIGALTGFLGHTQHLQTLRGSKLLYRQSLEDYCNIHNSGSWETSCSITRIFVATCFMLQGCQSLRGWWIHWQNFERYGGYSGAVSGWRFCRGASICALALESGNFSALRIFLISFLFMHIFFSTVNHRIPVEYLLILLVPPAIQVFSSFLPLTDAVTFKYQVD